MRKFLKVIYNIIRGITRTIFYLFILLLQGIIFALTYEKDTKKKITPRKARRIRLLSKIKMFLLNLFPTFLVKFLGVEYYRNYLNEHIGNGVQLCYERTDKGTLSQVRG